MVKISPRLGWTIQCMDIISLDGDMKRGWTREPRSEENVNVKGQTVKVEMTEVTEDADGDQDELRQS
jgi:hypothetical protein